MLHETRRTQFWTCWNCRRQTFKNFPLPVEKSQWSNKFFKKKFPQKVQKVPLHMKNAFWTTLPENNSRSLSPVSPGPEFRNYTKSGKNPRKFLMDTYDAVSTKLPKVFRWKSDILNSLSEPKWSKTNFPLKFFFEKSQLKTLKTSARNFTENLKFFHQSLLRIKKSKEKYSSLFHIV